MKPLTHLQPGEKAFIVDMRNGHLCAKLFELGVFPGDLVEIKENTSDNNSIVFKINGRIYNLVRQVAETIITNVVSFDICLN